MIEFHDPRADVGRILEAYSLQVDLRSCQAPKVAFLANGFPDSERFLEKIASVMHTLLPHMTISTHNKGNASIVANEDILNAIRGSDAAIAAYGHWGSCTTGTVRDGINIARLGIPAVALVTEAFWPQGDFVARSMGMPDVPRVRLPHPVAGTGDAGLTRIAEHTVPLILQQLAEPELTA